MIIVRMIIIMIVMIVIVITVLITIVMSYYFWFISSSVGDWVDDVMSGWGRLEDPCGAYYEGEFESGLKHGMVSYLFTIFYFI